MAMTAKRAVFFDIDGVLNREPGGLGIVRPEEIILLPGAGAAVAAAKRAGFLAVGVTNRSQVARGLITLSQLDEIFSHLQNLLAADGAALDRIYFCPHHPEGTVPEFAIRCECRKPGTLLFRRAIAELGIDAARSVTIGDTPRDIAAAKAIGTTAYGVRTGHGCQHSGTDSKHFPSPDRMFDDVAAAAAFATRSLLSKRILYVVSEDWYFLSHRLPMACAARDAGFDVHVATNVSNGAEAIMREGFTVHSVPFTRGQLALRGNLKTIRGLRRVHHQVNADITHRVALQPIVLDAIAAIRLPGKWVNAITGLGHTFIAKTPKAIVARTLIGLALRYLVNKEASVVLVQNPEDEAVVTSLGFLPDRVTLIPGSGVDVSGLQPKAEPDGTPAVGFVGRLLTNKGIHTLIAAHRIVRSQIADARLVVAGTPDPANLASISEQDLAEWRKEPGVTFLDHVTDIAGFWARVQIAALPSRGGEGIPKSLLEAAACGRAMVATDVPGCREIVIPGETGLLVPADDAAALAQAIQTLLTSPELRHTMGATARRLAETRFSAEAIGSATVDLYRRLADNKA